MRLIVRSTTFSAAIVATKLSQRASSTSAVANIDLAYENEVQNQNLQGNLLTNEECIPGAPSSLRGAADVGILFGCNDPNYICVEDVNSSLGGRCVAASAAKHRMLKDTPNPCTKCDGGGCEGLSQDFIDNNIGEGSCCGTNACKNVSATTTIGKGSCIGYKNCYGAQDATIEDGACNGDSIEGGDGYFGFVCAYLNGAIGDNSCYEYAACYQYEDDRNKGYQFNIRTGSCRGAYACTEGSGYSVGDQSCNGDSACYKKDFEDIGDRSCNGYHSCYFNKGSIGNDSCNARKACENNTATIGNSVCNNDQECVNNSTPSPTPPSGSTSQPTREPSNAPTKKPTTGTPSPTTTKPTGSPTQKPTRSPTKKPTQPPTKMPVPTSPPTNNPTKKPTTKAPTSSPTTRAPTKQPVTISPTLIFSVDLCYPGCGDFNYNDEFADMIKKYTPCSADECTVTIIDASSDCESCGIGDSSRRQRSLEDSPFQSSAILFEIMSDTPLNEQVVAANLNSNITNANEDLQNSEALFRVNSNYTVATLSPTVSPTMMPPGQASKSSKSDRKPKSSKSESSKKSGKALKDKHHKEGRPKHENPKGPQEEGPNPPRHEDPNGPKEEQPKGPQHKDPNGPNEEQPKGHQNEKKISRKKMAKQVMEEKMP